MQQWTRVPLLWPFGAYGKMCIRDRYRFKTDEGKKTELKSKIENDPFLSYIVNAIKYAAGETL